MLCYHQNTKSRIVIFGPTISPFLMMTKHMSYLKLNKKKNFEKAPAPSYASYQVVQIITRKG